MISTGAERPDADRRCAMHRLLLSLTLLLAADGARALPPEPSPQNCTVPSCITLVCTDGSVPSAIGTFDVVVRDLATNPMSGVSVTVDIGSAWDLRICSQQLPDVVANCSAGTVRGVTDANGRVTFTLLGGGTASASSSPAHAGRVFANGFEIGTPSVNTCDLDGKSGVGANDLGLWLTDFGSGTHPARADYDCSGTVGANDFSFWLTAFGSGSQAVSCAAPCGP